MPDAARKKLTLTTVVFWILFTYIIAALIWWFFSLMQQSEQIYNLEKQQLLQGAYDRGSPAFTTAIAAIEDERRRSHIKYIGEGSIFLLLIIIGAGFIFRSVRRQLNLQQQQQNFVMAVTHELKTPISVARLNLETLKRHQLDQQKQQKLIDSSLQETMRLDMLINNILISSQLEGKAYHWNKERLDFSQLAETELQQFANRYPDRKIEKNIGPGIWIEGDPLLLRLLLSNLLENANKYSEKSTPILCSLQKQASGTRLQVTDEGCGISDEEKSRVFRKFYRIGNEQTRTAKGTGLGLYICKKIATAHQANLHITDHVPQGSNFIVDF